MGQELKVNDNLEYVSATPPLEAIRILIALMVMTGKAKGRMLHIDARRAYVYAPAKRPVYINIPPEDRVQNEKAACGRLNALLYGTRDAARNWEEHDGAS